MTLLHYLVETIESKFPELLTFNEDLAHVDKAARVSVETLQKTLRQMDANIRNLENDLNNNKQPQGDDDMFSEVMGVSFTLGGYFFPFIIEGMRFGFKSKELL
jgi:diaphanous 2